MIEDILCNEQLRFKWIRLLDNAKYKSSNVGRASPIPTAIIRADNVKAAISLRSEIGTGKVKRQGAQAKLILGPDVLRKFLPVAQPNMQNAYKEAGIVIEWLEKLQENTRFDTNEETVTANRRRILELKEQLQDLNTNRDQPFGSTPVKDELSVMRAELTGYMDIPEHARSLFIKTQVVKLLKKITEIDPNGNEAKMLKNMEIEEYGESSVEEV